MARSKITQDQQDFKDQVREEAIKVAKTVVKKASLAPDYTEDDPDIEDELNELGDFDLEEEQELNVAKTNRFDAIRPHSQSESSNDDEGLDIFDRYNNSTDFPISYSIQRNGELLAKKEAPYSWDELQKEFGRGMYKVVAKNLLNGRMVKHEAKSVAQPKVDEKKLADKIASERDSVKDIIDTVNNQFTESLNAVQQSNSRQVEIMIEQMRSEKEERRQLEQRQREELVEIRKGQNAAEGGTNNLLATILPLLLKKDDGGNDKNLQMMMEMQKMNMENQKETQRLIMEIQKENREEARRLQDATNAMIAKLVTEMKPKESKPEFDAVTIMKMMQDAESKGMDKMREFIDLADERAERRIEEIQAEKGNGDKEDNGVIQSTLKLLLPALISQGMNKATSGPSPEQRLIENHRPSYQAPSQSPQVKKNVVTAKATVAQPTVIAAHKPVVKPLATPVHNVNTAQIKNPTPIVEKKPKTDTMSVETAKDLIITVATPILGEAFKEYLTSQTFNSLQTAKDTVIALQGHGISPQLAVQVISAEDIIQVCHGYGLASPETDQHLRAYYENIKKSATT